MPVFHCISVHYNLHYTPITLLLLLMLTMMMLMQMTTIKSGQTTFYVARSIYPSSAYHEAKTESNTTHPGVLFVPPTMSADGTVYCSVLDDSDVETEVAIDADYGG